MKTYTKCKIEEKQILNQVQNDKIFGLLCKVQGDRGKCSSLAPCDDKGIQPLRRGEVAIVGASLTRAGEGVYPLGKIKKILNQVQNDKNKKAAFTLAEVLITLGIIGVVAAMTIPTLMANIKGMRNRAQFKKTLSTLNQAVRMNKANYDWDFADGDSWNVTTSDWNCYSDTPDNVKSNCSIINANLKGVSYLGYFDGGGAYNRGGRPYSDYLNNYLDVIHDSGIEDKFVEIVSNEIFQLPDGSIVNIPAFFHKGCTLQNKADWITYCVGFIDVNGISGPNKMVKCSDGTVTDIAKDDNACIVKNNDITDIFPIFYYDSTVIPASNAAKYVLNTAK
ncbi:type II secretion system protein [bacterium]|nr:type II secretion system protein [bacterium]